VPAIRLLARVPARVRRDYVATAAAHWLTLASGLLLFHLVARRAGVAGFAYYQVARGVVSTVQPLALVGLVPALHRYLPRAGRRIRLLARQAFVLEVVLLNVLGLATVALADDVGRLFGIGGAREVRATVVLTAGVCLCTVAMAALRGCGQVGPSVLASLLGFGVLPLVAFEVTSRMDVFLTLQGVAMVAVACWGIAGAGPRRAEQARATPRPAPVLRTLLRYGIRRTPGDVALPGLFAFPTFFVAGASHSAAEAGYIGFATSAITLICSVFGMLSPVLLPRLSGHAHEAEAAGRKFGAELAHGLKVLPFAAAGVAAVASAVLLVAATPVVRWYLGTEFAGADTVIRYGAPVSIPLAVFYAARPTIDALREAPVTAVLLVGSLAVEVVATYGAALAMPAWQAALAGFGAAAVVLAVSSYVALLRAIPVPASKSTP
jgi:O-antigen/teichoic acid export membrane protein